MVTLVCKSIILLHQAPSSTFTTFILPNAYLWIQARTFRFLLCTTNASLKCTAALALHLLTVHVCDYIHWLLKSTACLKSSAKVRQQIMNDHSASLSSSRRGHKHEQQLSIAADHQSTKTDDNLESLSLPLGQQIKRAETCSAFTKYQSIEI